MGVSMRTKHVSDDHFVLVCVNVLSELFDVMDDVQSHDIVKHLIV